MTEDQWDRMFAVHLKGTFNCTRCVIETMLSQESGRIINIASVAGLTGTVHASHYSAAKGGIISFTKALAKEVAPFGITVNAVAPAVFDTPILKGVAEEVQELYRSRTPVGRMGRPREVATLCAYLASDNAGYITGQVISPNGGYYT